MTERGADFDAKREAYESARDKLADLIDNPIKAIPVDEYLALVHAADMANRDAHAAMIEAWKEGVA